VRVLIVEQNSDLAAIWRGHLERLGFVVICATTSDRALESLVFQDFEVLVINLLLPDGGALGLADYARVAHPLTNVVFVTNDTFFSDGSLFAMAPNLRMMIRVETPPEDVAAIVSHCAQLA
jgi:DNA-binding response OmpR family regulator